jgi:hypothetical protein
MNRYRGAGLDFVVLPRPEGYLLLMFVSFVVVRYADIPPAFRMTMMSISWAWFSYLELRLWTTKEASKYHLTSQKPSCPIFT